MELYIEKISLKCVLNCNIKGNFANGIELMECGFNEEKFLMNSLELFQPLLIPTPLEDAPSGVNQGGESGGNSTRGRTQVCKPGGRIWR